MSELPKNPQALLAETSWLRGLARELTHDPSTAEDLVQETMLAALEAPAPTRAKLRTWLEAVARRLSAGLYRSDDRRRAREQQVARADVVPSAADMLDQFSLHRAVVEAVMQVTEPSRTAVLMRFWHGLPPRAIAHRLTIPVETVRTRIKRGLAQIRSRLDQDYGGRGGWAVSLLSLPIAGTPAAVTGIVISGLVMKKYPAVAAAVLVCCTGALWWGVRTVDSNTDRRLAEIGDADHVAVPTDDHRAAAPHHPRHRCRRRRRRRCSRCHRRTDSCRSSTGRYRSRCRRRSRRSCCTESS